MEKGDKETIPLKVLYLEDSPRDAEITRHLLLDAKYDLRMDCTATEKEFVSLLHSSKYDVILADFKLPGFDAFGALRWSKDICPDTPLICVSGTIGEETAVELLKQGAVDYVLKDRLGRLPAVINRALDGVKDKEARRLTEEALSDSEARYRALVEQMPVIAYTDSAEQIGQTLYISPQLKATLGYDPQEWIADNDLWRKIMHEDDRQSTMAEYTQSFETGDKFESEYRLITRDGRIIWIHDEATLIRGPLGKPLFWQGIMQDRSARKQAEEALRTNEMLLSNALKIAHLGHWEYDVNKDLFTFNDHFYHLFRTTVEQVGGYTMSSANYTQRFVHPDDLSIVNIETQKAIETTDPNFNRQLEHRIIYADGGVGYISIRFFIVKDSQGRTVKTFGVNQDITEQKRVEGALLESEERIRKKLDAILLPEGDIGMLDLADVVDSQAIQSLMDDFYNVTHIGTAICNLDGRVLVTTGWQDICTKFHRIHPETCKHCIESDLQLSQEVEPGSFKLYRCKNNMWDIVTPIIVGDRKLGNMYFGQFFFDDETIDYDFFRTQAQKYGFDEAEYLAALDRVPHWSQQAVSAIISFYAKLAGIIATLSYSNIKLARSITERDKAEADIRNLSKFPAENPNPVVRIRQDGVLLFTNPAAEPLLAAWGWKVGKKVAKNWQKWITSVISTGISKEIEVPYEDQVFSFSLSPVLEAGYINGYGYNITERRRAEDARTLSETRMKSLYELSQKQFETEKELIEYGLEEAVKLTGSNIGFFHFINIDQVNLELNTWSSEVRKTCTSSPDRHLSLDKAGVWADCVRTKQPAIYNDYPNLPEKKGYPEGHSPIFRQLSVPIIDKDLVVVVCGVGNKATPYDDMDVLQLQLYMDGLWKIVNRKRNEQTLQESEQKYRSFIEQSEDAAVLTDENGAIIEWNQAAERIFGQPRDNVEGRFLWDVQFEAALPAQKTPQVFEQIKTTLLATLKTGQGNWLNKLMETTIQHSDGKYLTIQTMAFPIQTKNGIMLGSISRDITERKQADKELQASEEKYRSLFENVPVGVYRTNLEGKILTANPALVQMFGYENEDEFKNHSILDFYVDLNERKKIITQYRKNHEDHNVEIRMKRKDGQHIIVLDNCRILEDQKETFFEGTLTEITTLKKFEEELQLRIEETTALYETSQLVTTQLELSILLRIIVERAAILLRAKSGFLYLYDKTRADLELTIETTDTIPVGVRLELGEGIAGRVAQTLTPMIVEDYSSWEGRSLKNDAIDISATVEVPMIYGGELIGVLGVEELGRSSRKFNEEDMRILSSFATQAASAIHNARLYEETRNRASQLSLLYDAGLALNSKLDEHDQLEFLFKIAMDSLSAERAEFYRVDEEKNQISFEVGVGYHPEILKVLNQISLPIDEKSGFVGWVVNNRLPIYIKDLKADTRNIEYDGDLRSGIWVPVEHNGQLQGVLSVCSTHVDAFQPDHERLLILFANQAAVAMENARLIKETQHQLSQLNALHEIDLAIAGSVDLRISLAVILNQSMQQLGMDAATILLLNPHTQILEYAAGIGFHTNALQHTQIKMGEGFAGRAAFERKLIHIPDISTRKTGFLRSPGFAMEGFITYTVKPLIARGQVKGVLEIFHRVMHKPNRTWFDFLDAFANQSAIAIDSAELFQSLQIANTGLNMAYDNTLEGWGRALELRDKETEGHTRRGADITMKLARALGIKETDLIHIYRGALLHDIGKMGVPDSIVLKPGKLTEEEWKIMRKHPQYAYDMLSPISFLKQAMDIPYYHHEKWDGSGYPHGLKGNLIPFAARIFAVVDVYDALTSDRPYRPAWTKEEALKYISTNSGTHFDPHVVDAFIKLI